MAQLSSFQDILSHWLLCPQCLKESYLVISRYLKDRNRKKKVQELTKVTRALSQAVQTTLFTPLCYYDTDSCFKCKRSGPITLCASNNCRRLLHVHCFTGFLYFS